MARHTVELEGPGIGPYRLLVDGIDLSTVVAQGGLTLAWDDALPVVTLRLVPSFGVRLKLDDAQVRLIETLRSEPPEVDSEAPAVPRMTAKPPADTSWLVTTST